MRQVHAEEMDLLPHAADHRHRFAEIHLRVTGRVRQGHEGLAPPRPLDPDVILDDRVAAGKAMLVTKPLEYPLGRVTLLHRRRAVRLQDRLDHRDQTSQLRLIRRPLPHIPRRHREPAHLRDRLSAQSKNPSRFPSALAIVENKLPDRCVNLHDKHPFGIPPSTGQRNALPLAGFYSAAVAKCAAPVAGFVTAAHTRPLVVHRRGQDCLSWRSAGSRQRRANPPQVAGFKSEWWPASCRNRWPE